MTEKNESESEELILEKDIKFNNDVDRKIYEILSFHQILLPKFEEKWRQAKININAIFGEHWSKEEQRAHKDVGMKPRNFALLFNKIMGVLGLEKQARERYAVESQGIEDELTAFIYNQKLRHIEEMNIPKFEFLRSDIFFQGFVGSYGALKVERYINKEGEIDNRFKKIPYNNLLWDLNFKNYEMDDCVRKQHFEWKYLDDLVNEYPELKKYQDQLYSYESDSETFPLRANQEYFLQYDKDGDTNARRLIKVIHDYNRIYKKIWEVHSLRTEEPHTERCDSKADAEEYIAEQMKELRDKNKEVAEGMKMLSKQISSIGAEMPAIDVPDITLNSEDYFKMTDRVITDIEYTIVAGADIISEPVLLNRSTDPLFVYFSLFVDGEWWTPVQVSLDYQQFFDKMLAQMDRGMGTDLKQVFELFVPALHESQTPEDAKAIIETTGGVLYKSQPVPLLTPSQRAGIDPNYFNFIEFLSNFGSDFYGGNNINGLQETSNESGKAVALRQKAAMGMNINYLDGLRRFEESLGRYLLEEQMDINISTESFTKKVLGRDLLDKIREVLAKNGMYQESIFENGMGYLTVPMDKEVELEIDGKKYLQKKASDANLQIVVKKVSSNIDEQEMLFQKLTLLKQLGYPVPIEMFAENMGLSPLESARLKDNYEKFEQAQAEIMKQQQADEKARVSAEVLKSQSTVLDKPSNIAPPVPQEQAQTSVTDKVLQ